MRYPIILVLAVTLVVGPGGCATATKSERSDAPAQRIGVVLSVSAPPQFNTPAKGAGAGAARGAGGGFQAGAQGRELGVILLPLLVVGGAIVGALKAENAARVEEAEATLGAALGRLKPGEAVRDRLIEVAHKETRHSLVALRGPLDTEGIDTVLELAVQQLHLRGDGINPPFRLILSVRTRLVRVADGELIHEKTFEFESEKRKFVDWAANNAQPLREGLDNVALKLANEIVARVLARDLSGEPRP